MLKLGLPCLGVLLGLVRLLELLFGVVLIESAAGID
jgi:hypothetical protein